MWKIHPEEVGKEADFSAWKSTITVLERMDPNNAPFFFLKLQSFTFQLLSHPDSLVVKLDQLFLRQTAPQLVQLKAPVAFLTSPLVHHRSKNDLWKTDNSARSMSPPKLPQLRTFGHLERVTMGMVDVDYI
jgi:hypothetical protein